MEFNLGFKHFEFPTRFSCNYTTTLYVFIYIYIPIAFVDNVVDTCWQSCNYYFAVQNYIRNIILCAGLSQRSEIIINNNSISQRNELLISHTPQHPRAYTPQFYLNKSIKSKTEFSYTLYQLTDGVEQLLRSENASSTTYSIMQRHV